MSKAENGTDREDEHEKASAAQLRHHDLMRSVLGLVTIYYLRSVGPGRLDVVFEDDTCDLSACVDLVEEVLAYVRSGQALADDADTYLDAWTIETALPQNLSAAEITVLAGTEYMGLLLSLKAEDDGEDEPSDPMSVRLCIGTRIITLRGLNYAQIFARWVALQEDGGYILRRAIKQDPMSVGTLTLILLDMLTWAYGPSTDKDPGNVAVTLAKDPDRLLGPDFVDALRDILEAVPLA